MRTPEQVAERLAATWRRRWPDWLGGSGDWPLAIPLDPPTESVAAASWSAFSRWIEMWRPGISPGTVRWATRAWARMGGQSIPTHVEFGSAADVARVLGASTASDFARTDARFRERCAAWPGIESAWRAHAAWLQTLSDEDFRRASGMLDWLAAHPQSGLYPRQLPVEGVDTKWLEHHSGPIAALLAARLGVARRPLATVAGLAVDPPRRRLRLLDPASRGRLGGLSDVSVRLDELAHLDLGAEIVLIVENQQSALACEEMANAVVVVGGGFSVTELACVPWLQRSPILYWGDIDAAGYQILSALRTQLPHVKSALMDESTLLVHRPLWSKDGATTRPHDLPGLTSDEAAVYRGLLSGRWGHGVRLEQERIPWRHAWQTLCTARSSLVADRAVPAAD
jgi:hypothetical protein